MKTVLAVDLGGTKTTIARTDSAGRVSGLEKHPSEHTLAATVAAIAPRAKGVAAVGVIVPGIYDTRSGMAWCPNLWGRDEVPLRDVLAPAVGVPVVIDSDRSGYVLGEQWMGVARGLANVVFVAIGTGIGVGVLAGGRVMRGAHGIAGAAGWFALTPEWQDIYARTGCWEAEAAGPGVARVAAMENAETVVAAARSGSEEARTVLASAARFTGMAVANLISLLNPEIVVLGGGFLHGAADLLFETIRDEAARWAQPIAFSRTRIELTTLGESAGLLGAARLAHLHLSYGDIHVSEEILRKNQ
jgi:glucokinase